MHKSRELERKVKAWKTGTSDSTGNESISELDYMHGVSEKEGPC